ncbi:MAG: PHP domain-containing protein, partial [Clostridiales bacterium]|nr:PHP domain-containing protein [Clostridiales bacterium]
MDCPKTVPLLGMFPRCQLNEALSKTAACCQVRHAVLHPAQRAVELEVTFSAARSEQSVAALERAVCTAYGLRRVEVRQAEENEDSAPAVPLVETAPPEADEGGDIPLPEEAPPEPDFPTWTPEPLEERPPVEADPFARTEALRAKKLQAVRREAPARKNKKPRSRPVSENGMIYGKRIRGHAIPMSDLDLNLGTVCVTGKIYADNSRELKKRNAWVVSFNITDNTNSVTVSKFMENKEAEPVMKALKKGTYVTVEGKLSMSHYTGDMELSPYAIAPAEPPEERMDTAPEKRVELHLHTRFSTMDALTEVKDAVKRAIKWGHKAIAITDHGVAQAFPDACAAAGDKIKVIYGTEAYFVNDVDEQVVVKGECRSGFDDEIVCFDLETTGLSTVKDRIIEIGAVLLKGDQILGKFDTFVDPGKPIPRKIVGLTGITDEMVAGAPSQEEALNQFLDWAGDRLLAAHNADFDMGFLSRGCQRMGRPFHNPSLDTLVLSQHLLPNLGKYTLDSVSGALNLPEFNHHRACDDAAMVGYMLVPFWKMLRELGVKDISGINARMPTLRSGRKRKQRLRHLIVLAKNQSGLRNLYKLFSLAHLEHLPRRPVMPKGL